ncbi:unnamed protein product [Fraxinus pennsylvanica]|uniref:MSP domain-containing protein n=1 Tax=Fraxinus pennsylvanica TaxID=56036 RepID=A0AAD2EDW0_9LAMI|nr:unnamed protein product [Fraxinus pennsylvanica]
MAIADSHHRHQKWRLCGLWQSATTSSPSSTQKLRNNSQSHNYQNGGVGSRNQSSSSTVSISSFARLILPARRRLRLDPSSNLYFPYEPGKQARSAIRIKNSSKSYVAFKFQTTAPKSCYMRPPGGILAPGENLVATVFKFVEHPENNEKPTDQKSKVKFNIMSLKVKGGTDFVPELFDEQRDQVTLERILRVVFLDPEHSTPALEKLKRQLAEADAATEARKKPPPDTGPRVVGEGLVIDEWKERREKYLARQQDEAVVSMESSGPPPLSATVYIVERRKTCSLSTCINFKFTAIMLEGKAVIGETDMLETMQQEALHIAAKALDFFDVTEATEIARFIKKEFDRQYGSGWQSLRFCSSEDQMDKNPRHVNFQLAIEASEMRRLLFVLQKFSYH